MIVAAGPVNADALAVREVCVAEPVLPRFVDRIGGIDQEPDDRLCGAPSSLQKYSSGGRAKLMGDIETDFVLLAATADAQVLPVSARPFGFR